MFWGTSRFAWGGAHPVQGALASAVGPFQVYALVFFEFTVEHVNTNPCVLDE